MFQPLKWSVKPAVSRGKVRLFFEMRNVYAPKGRLQARLHPILLILAASLWPSSAFPAEVTVAVAANFAAPMRQVAAAFEAETHHRARLAIGATGAFYAQVRSGAPFDMLLAADEETPSRLERDGFAAAGSRFTYAIGRLVLWSANPRIVDAHGDILAKGSFDKLAIANPKLAPYGAAAVQALQKLGAYDRVQAKLVQGENIAQAYQFVATGNAQLGFVALSQVVNTPGSKWIVPANLYTPLRQDAAILKAGQGNAAAAELAQFLKGEKARGIIRAYGYGLP
jgi:molybdate transport system substrate-binding protein